MEGERHLSAARTPEKQEMHAGVNRAGRRAGTEPKNERGSAKTSEGEGCGVRERQQETRLQPKSMPSEAGALQIHTKWHPRHRQRHSGTWLEMVNHLGINLYAAAAAAVVVV